MIVAFKRQLYFMDCRPTHHSEVWSSGPTERIHVATPCPLKTVLLQVLTSTCSTVCVEIPIKIWQSKHMNFTVTTWNHNMNWYLSFVTVLRGLWCLRRSLVKMSFCVLRLQIENFFQTLTVVTKQTELSAHALSLYRSNGITIGQQFLPRHDWNYLYETLLYPSKDASLGFPSVCVESPACVFSGHSVFP